MSDEQIKHMVDRFLSWKLPEDFNPDGGITFKKTFNENTPHPMKHEPSGTNLFDAKQAEEMIRYMMDGYTPTQPTQPSAALALVNDFQNRLDKFGHNKADVLVTVSLSQNDIDTLRQALQPAADKDIEIERLRNGLRLIASCEKRADGDCVDIAQQLLKKGG